MPKTPKRSRDPNQLAKLIVDPDQVVSISEITRLQPTDCNETDLSIRILTGHCRTLLHGLDSESFNCCLTSPRICGRAIMTTTARSAWSNRSPILVFREVKRVPRKDGVCWIVIDNRWRGDHRQVERKRGSISVGLPTRPIPNHESR